VLGVRGRSDHMTIARLSDTPAPVGPMRVVRFRGKVGRPHSLKLGGPCQPLPIALPKTEAVADSFRDRHPGAGQEGGHELVDRSQGSRRLHLRVHPRGDSQRARVTAPLWHAEAVLF
jgi:hypothetical protein